MAKYFLKILQCLHPKIWKVFSTFFNIMYERVNEITLIKLINKLVCKFGNKNNDYSQKILQNLKRQSASTFFEKPLRLAVSSTEIVTSILLKKYKSLDFSIL